jgi:ribosomal subunit interface protein
METPLQITFRHLPPSAAIEGVIRERASWLERFFERITSCRVVVEAPHHRRQQGNLFVVRIELTVPGGELVVNRSPSEHQAHQDVYVAVHDAFDEARRILEDHARRQREPKRPRARAPRGRVVRLFDEEGYGFIEAADGREIYFHRNSVLKKRFDRLEVGMEVRFTEEEGDQGPQASTVEPLTRQLQRQ